MVLFWILISIKNTSEQTDNSSLFIIEIEDLYYIIIFYKTLLIEKNMIIMLFVVEYFDIISIDRSE